VTEQVSASQEGPSSMDAHNTAQLLNALDSTEMTIVDYITEFLIDSASVGINEQQIHYIDSYVI
jgi:hypothetical protein